MAKLKKRADGRYQKRVYLGRSADGKPQYKAVFGRTIREAEEKAARLKLQLGKGIDIDAARDTFWKWADRYKALKIAEGVSLSQQSNIEGHIKHMACIARVAIGEVSTGDIQKIVNALADWHEGKRPLAHKTLGEIVNTARRIFDYAIQSRVIDFNPAIYVRVPRGSGKTERGPITETQQQWVRDTPHRAQRAAMLMLYAGLRRGEASALTWGDIDFRCGTIRVSKAVEYIHGQPHVKLPKTEAGNRTVKAPHLLIEFLATERPKDPCILVCHNTHGGMLSEQSWRTLWDSYMRDLNVKYGYHGMANKLASRKKDESGKPQGILPMRIQSFTPHQLRHTFCTLLYLAGVDVLTARNQMGHSDAQTTLSIYTHLDNQHAGANMDKVNTFLSKMG